MKCPHCGYAHGWDSNKNETIAEDSGEFYSASNSIRMEYTEFGQKYSLELYGCPECKKVFMN